MVLKKKEEKRRRKLEMRNLERNVPESDEGEEDPKSRPVKNRFMFTPEQDALIEELVLRPN